MMIYSVTGKLALRGESFVALEVGGFSFKIFTNKRTLEKLKEIGGEEKFLTHLHVRENALELYGFLTPEELRFFELLNSVAGVGPKSALAVMDIAELKSLAAAVKEGRPDLLTRASGIGRKTAERIVLEVRNRVEGEASEATVRKMESDADLAETLVGLGYRRDQARAALAKVPESVVLIEERLKLALRILSGKEK